MINQLPITSTVEQPRGMVFINGTALKWLSFHVDTTTYYRADTFEAQLSLTGQPAGFDWAYFADAPAILIEIYAGYPSNPFSFNKANLDKIFVGQVDDISIEPVSAVVTLSGRDLTAKFIDNKTYEKFANMTASQIVTLLANRRGLTPVVTETKQRVGLYYDIDQVRMQSLQTEWDLLTFLAQEQNFAVFVKGMELHFEPLPTEQTDPYVLQWTPEGFSGSPSINVTSIKFARSLTIARDIIVEVRSWNSLHKKPFEVTAKSTPNKKTALAAAAQPIGDAQVFPYIFPGLDKQQAITKAKKILKELSQHERRMEFTAPANNLIQKSSVVQVKGTNTSYDQIYFPDSVTRSMIFEGGFTMSVTAKNHSPNTEVLI